MPYKDPEQRRQFQADYQKRYNETHADELRTRRAEWFQANKDRLREKAKADYHAKRQRIALDTLHRIAL